MRVNLIVPYSEKDEAKRLGARWDAVRKVWYVENAADLEKFVKWMSHLHCMAYYQASRYKRTNQCSN